MLMGLCLFGLIDVEAEDLMTLFCQIYCHGEPHVSKANESDLGKRENGSSDNSH